MKKKLLASLTGIAMSAAVIVSGCAGTTSSAAENGTKSVVQEAGAENAGDQAAGQPSGQAAEQPAGQPSGQAAEQPADQPSGQAAEQATVELKTVEPSTYAGQTVYGKVTAVNGSEVTVSLGTMKKKSKKTTESSTTNGNAAEESAKTDDSAAEESAKTDDSAAEESAKTDGAAAENKTAGKPDKSQGKGKQKKSPFTASGEQMTVTISDGLTEKEIKEGNILKLTLDDSGTVTSVEVKSKSKGRSGGGSKTENSSENGGTA